MLKVIFIVTNNICLKLIFGISTLTLIGYALLYYIREILRRDTHNLSYIYMGMLVTT